MGNTLRTMAAVDGSTAAQRRAALDARQLREDFMGPRGEIGGFVNERVRVCVFGSWRVHWEGEGVVEQCGGERRAHAVAPRSGRV
jgi:hypothetical protein